MITDHKPGDAQAILTPHDLPRDAEVAMNAIAKLNATSGHKEIRRVKSEKSK